MPQDDLRAKIAKQVGENVRKAREACGLNQKDLLPLGFHQGWLSDVERGVKLPQIDTLVTLAGVLQTTVTDLLEGVGPPKRKKPPGA